MRDRPVPLTVIGVLSVVVAVGLFVAASVMLVSGGFSLVTWVSSVELTRSMGQLAQGVSTLVLAIVAVVLGRAILRGPTWAWYFALLVYGAQVIAGIVEVTQRAFEGLWTIVVFGALLWYFTERDVREYFGVTLPPRGVTPS